MTKRISPMEFKHMVKTLNIKSKDLAEKLGYPRHKIYRWLTDGIGAKYTVEACKAMLDIINERDNSVKD